MKPKPSPSGLVAKLSSHGPLRFLILVAGIGFARSAAAQTISPGGGLVSSPARAVVSVQALGQVGGGPPLNLSRRLASRGAPYSKPGAADPSDMPRTAISHRFTPDGVVGSVGYLCGIQRFAPDYYQVGGGPAAGYERGLTFVGAQVGIAFK